MTNTAALRLFGLTALALVGALIALATTRHHGARSATGTLPAATGDWYRALASVEPPATKTHTTVCGRTLGAKTLGVAHPVLPCNVKLYIDFDGKTVLTQVIDRGPYVAGNGRHISSGISNSSASYCCAIFLAASVIGKPEKSPGSGPPR